jgi:phosphatidylserine/phosphatidylglycerophosphate/cardiolipin synthase-like enzyme
MSVKTKPPFKLATLPPLPQKKKGHALPFYLATLVCFAIWFVWRSLTPTLPALGEPPRLYSNQCQQDLTLTFLEAIQKAKKSIYLVMFGLTDPAILKVLSKKIEQKVEPIVYYDTNGSPNLYRMLDGCELHPIRQVGLMHHKVLILDDEMVFLGSANLTTQSLRMHDNLVIGLHSKRIASFLREKVPYCSGHIQTPVGGQEVDLWILPDPNGHALSELKRKLRNANRSIRAALFTFTHPALADELILAQKRGVAVTVVIDLHSGLGASAKTVGALKKAGVRILYSQGVQLLHHKFVLIDDSTLIAGSANWTKAAFTKNSDCLAMLHNLTTDQRSYMNYLWKRISIAAREPEF